MQGETKTSEPSDRHDNEIRPLYAVLSTLAGIAVLAVLIIAIDPLHSAIGDAIGGDTSHLREDLRGLGFSGVLITFTLAIAHVVIWYPAEILDTAAGYVYGFGPGLVLIMFSWLVSGMLSYWIGRHAARPLLYRMAGRERFDRLEQMAEAGGVALLLGIRLVPVIPFSLFSMAAGAARADPWTFAWTTAVGYLPLTAVFVYLGSRLETLSATDPALWIGAAVLIGLLVATQQFHRRWRQAGDDGPAAAEEDQSEPDT